ncbi:MAG TPA: DUF3043 domain-containing protein [Streptosporangiaceae bacterium]|nr:DUF3043 domain-containing protein [Streptosporangiaceae bacterium]
MFRRRQPATADPPAEDAAAPEDGQPDLPGRSAVTAGKGRPTPKRSESERRRRPINAPGDRKEANRQYRERQRSERARRQQGLQKGEQWALPPRDRGPVKALARDYVDSRRRLSEFYMYGLVVLLILLFIPSQAVKAFVPLGVLAAVLVMLVEGVFIGRGVRSLAQKRLPGESTQGVRLYAAMRALQIRQLRVPKPRIRPGESF